MSLSRPNNLKIRPDHLARQAIIYIRQSTLMQVRENTGSTARQYDLVPRALELGWAREHIRVIDQDQGQSGASSVARDGFQWLVAEVGLKQAGAVFCLEASRLARSCSDWYRLLEICALTDTLVIDEEGIYDPGQYNDRLLLGFKGTMSEAELHWLRQRLLGGKLAKAEVGQLRFRLPVGLVYDSANRVVIDPDQEVSAAVRLVFELFAEHGSALAVVTHFAKHQLRFPTRLWGGGHDGELIWGRLASGRVLSILHNPLYAGAYVYGRTVTRTQLLPGEAPRIKGRTRQIKQEEWPIVLLDVHPGYLTWEQFRRNQQRLDDNRTWRPEDHRGAVRQGAALLQGIVLCGRCGRRMSVRYLRDGLTPSYECNQAHTQHAARTCQTMRGDKIDQVVKQRFLEAIEPAQLEVSLAALNQIEARARQIERQWQLRRERAQYEVDLARRRFIAIDPENRLVARSLEREWNERLAALETLGREYVAWGQQAIHPLSAEDRQLILALAQDLPTVWHSPTTTNSERKQLLRFLIRDVTLTRREKIITIAIRWQTGALTTFDIPRLRKSWEVRQTDAQAVELIRQLAPDHTDQQIAARLNQEGLNAGLGGSFTQSKVGFIRWTYDIATGCPERPKVCPSGQRGDGRYSAQKAAELLNVHVSTISEWCQQGLLDCVRSAPMSPRWIKLTPEVIVQLRRPVRRSWSRSASTSAGEGTSDYNES
jgi:DNA invertase Pin-like site-specific DNA recombinase